MRETLETSSWLGNIQESLEVVRYVTRITFTVGNERFLSKSSVECLNASKSEANDKSASSVIVFGEGENPRVGEERTSSMSDCRR